MARDFNRVGGSGLVSMVKHPVDEDSEIKLARQSFSPELPSPPAALPHQQKQEERNKDQEREEESEYALVEMLKTAMTVVETVASFLLIDEAVIKCLSIN